MAISATALNEKIKEALVCYNSGDYKNERDNPKHLDVIGKTMKDYFEKNIEVVYSWIAQTSSSPPALDPIDSFQSEAHFTNFSLMPLRNLDGTPVCEKTALPALARHIKEAFEAAVIKHPTGFSITPGTFSVAAPPKLEKVKDLDEKEDPVLICICVPVCAWVLTLINPTPLPGARGSYLGNTTSMEIK